MGDTGAAVRIPLSPVENVAVGAVGGALETCLQMPIRAALCYRTPCFPRSFGHPHAVVCLRTRPQ
jgi:hypothetical protein